MRNLMLLLIGAVLGAVAFHVYYLRLPATERCGWDHPADAGAGEACRETSVATGAHGYAVKPRRDLDTLIGRVAH